MDSADRYAIEKQVRDQVSKSKLDQYKKAYKKKDKEEYKLETMPYDRHNNDQWRTQSKNIERATKEYEAIRDDIAKDLIGKYSKRNMGFNGTYDRIFVQKGKNRVGDILDRIATNELSEYYGDKDYYKTDGWNDQYYKKILEDE